MPRSVILNGATSRAGNNLALCVDSKSESDHRAEVDYPFRWTLEASQRGIRALASHTSLIRFPLNATRFRSRREWSGQQRRSWNYIFVKVEFLAVATHDGVRPCGFCWHEALSRPLYQGQLFLDDGFLDQDNLVPSKYGLLVRPGKPKTFRADTKSKSNEPPCKHDDQYAANGQSHTSRPRKTAPSQSPASTGGFPPAKNI